MPWIIRIICFVLTTAIFIPIESALSAANTAAPLIWLIAGVIYLFIFYIPSNALIAMWEKKDSTHSTTPSGSTVKLLDKLLSYLLFALLGLLGQLPLLFMSVTPFFIIPLSPLFIAILAFIAYIFPISSIVFWIWGVVCAFQSGWSTWSVIYCVMFLVVFVPQYLGALLKKPNKSDYLY